MNDALLQFEINLARVRELDTLTRAIDKMTTPAVDVADILRAEIVLAVSAFDYFIHELVRLGMIESYKGNRPATESFGRFKLPLNFTQHALNGAQAEAWLGEAIRQQHSWQSFQDPDKVADAIRLISNVRLWEALGNKLGVTPIQAKNTLKTIVERRNRIAHEADVDPANPGFRWPIDLTLTQDSVRSIETIGIAIYEIVSQTP